MAKDIREWSYDEMIDEATGKVLHKTIRGDMRDGVIEAINVAMAWQREKALSEAAEKQPAGNATVADIGA